MAQQHEQELSTFNRCEGWRLAELDDRVLERMAGALASAAADISQERAVYAAAANLSQARDVTVEVVA